jgi:two-component sensor histidine kinase
VPAGRVEIVWRLAPEMSGQTPERLHLTWSEKNGPVVQAPEKRSFGSRLIETLGKQLKGDVRLIYEPTGFVYTLDVPLASLTLAS